MGLHSLLISAMDGTTLLSRFYPSFASESEGENNVSKISPMQAWENEVQSQTHGLWMTADHAPQVAIGFGGVIIAFRKVDDLTIFLSSKDHNEILLAEALNTITVILKSLCEDKGGGGRVTEAKFQKPNILGKFCVCLDELMPGGILESMDPDDVLAMSFSHFGFATFGGVSTGGCRTERNIGFAITVCYHKGTTRPIISVYKKLTWRIPCA